MKSWRECGERSMPQKIKIKYTPVAVDDMDEIFSYISKENIDAAEILVHHSTAISNILQDNR